MAKNTIFQNLGKAISGEWNDSNGSFSHTNSYDLSNLNNKVLFKTTDKKSYEENKLELQQNAFLHDRWIRTNRDLSVKAYSGLNNVKLMYRDADLMDAYPEIGAALDILSEESSISNDKGQIVNVYSNSERIKSILEDLFVNRLRLQVTSQMVIRATCKYGNQFMMLNIDKKQGVKGWRQLPVFDVERIENGIYNSYASGGKISNTNETKFLWVDEAGESIPFLDWQIAHFRLISNSMYLPYGVSSLNAARRSWRELALMEDMMLIYRLERSMERRVYKIYVGAIDDKDVNAYVEDVANSLKRTPIIDPMTGQIDLRKNVLCAMDDIFIPVRTQDAPTPIDTLSAGQNMTAIDDIKYIENKVVTCLRIPKAFLNFEEAEGDGNSLALEDIRFTRTVNKIQQMFLMELTKIATIHLYILGFKDDLNNFSLTMNNPSSQAEQLEIENLQKKIQTARDAVSDPGNGIPIMSQQRALKEILKWSDKDIKANLEEIRLEKGLTAELEKTSQIIKRSGVFDNIDRIYGEPDAEYMDDAQQGDGGNMDGSMDSGGGMGGADFGSDLDNIGNMGENDEGDITGEEGGEPTEEMEGGDEQQQQQTPQSNENYSRKKRTLINESLSKNETMIEKADILDKSFILNENMNQMINNIDNFIKEKNK